MTVKTIQGLEDMEGMNRDDFLKLRRAETGNPVTQGIHAGNSGIFYERTKQGIALIATVFNPTTIKVGRVDYDFIEGVFVSTQISYPFQETSPEYQRYHDLLLKLYAEEKETAIGDK